MKEETNMSFTDRIRAGEFDNKLDYPRSITGGDIAAARRAYDAESRALYDLFKSELLKDLGLDGHPKAEKVFSMAWDDGHSSGSYEDVYNYAGDYAKLVL